MSLQNEDKNQNSRTCLHFIPQTTLAIHIKKNFIFLGSLLYVSRIYHQEMVGLGACWLYPNVLCELIPDGLHVSTE